MSWDGIIFRAPPVDSVNDLPSDFQLPPLGTTDEIGETFKRSFPEWEHTRGRCSVCGEDFSLTLTFEGGKSEPVQTSIGVRIGGFPGPEALALLKRVCDAFDARFIDAQNGEFADFDVMTRKSMDAYSEWVDRAMASYNRTDDRLADGQALES